MPGYAGEFSLPITCGKNTRCLRAAPSLEKRAKTRGGYYPTGTCIQNFLTCGYLLAKKACCSMLLFGVLF